MLDQALSRKALEWLANGEKNPASETLAMWLAFGVRKLVAGHPPHPRTPSDFDRCLGLLAECPELRERLPHLSTLSPAWAALGANWRELEDQHLHEVGLGFTKGPFAMRTYAALQDVLAGGSGAPTSSVEALHTVCAAALRRAA